MDTVPRRHHGPLATVRGSRTPTESRWRGRPTAIESGWWWDRRIRYNPRGAQPPQHSRRQV